jgi:hypothetical protein
MPKTAAAQAKEPERNALATPTDLSPNGVSEISIALRPLLAHVFALYLKTKNFTGTCVGGTFGITTYSWTNKQIRFFR